MRSTGPVRNGIACCCLLTLPLLTFAQSSGHQNVIAVRSTAAAASFTLSAALAGAPDLPDAPSPSGQSTAAQAEEPNQKQKQNQTPPSSGSSLSLGDLGFTPAQTEANAKLQARLNKRTHMLKVHQTLGLITVAPMVAAILVSGGAKQKHSHLAGASPTEPSSAGVDLHAALGSLTAVMYGATAYYAIAAPKIAGVKPRGAIRVHRDLVWVHLPGMVLTPILGSMALNQENQGEKVHGIASAHAYVAWTTVAAYGASIVAVSWPIHWKFWEK